MPIGYFIDRPELRVFENDKVWTYTMKRSESGFPFYIAPKEKDELHKSIYMGEVLFLPILQDVTRHVISCWGYRFIFGSRGATTMDIAPGSDDGPKPQAHFQMGFEASRIRYIIDTDPDRKSDIYIDYMGDGLFPTRYITFQGAADEMNEVVNTIMMKIIDEHCKWYALKKL